MFQGFWGELERPIIGLAPMDGVTDAAMRYMTKKYGNPEVMFTEFTNVEGISHAIRSHKWSQSHRLARNFKYDESQRPIVAQLFGKDPESFRVAAKLMVELGFDGVDINMGCPAKNVSEHGSGAALIGQPDLAGEIIKATIEGVSQGHSVTGKLIPVSVKTRTGVSEIVTEKWIEHLLQFDLAAITLHGRTLKQMYQGLADWEEIGKAARMVKGSGKETIFLGNGDVDSVQSAVDRVQRYGVDGVLMGRAAMGAPWVFEKTQNLEKSKTQRMEIAIEHARKFEEFFPDDLFMSMRKHLAWYAKGFEGASELRQKLVLTNSAAEVEEILR